MSVEDVAPEPGEPCKACGRTIRIDSRFCVHCGAYLRPWTDVVAERQAEMKAWTSVKGCIALYAICLGAAIPLAWLDEKSEATGILVVETIELMIVLGYLANARLAVWPFVAPTRRALAATGIGLACLLPMLALDLGYHGLLADWFQVEVVSLSDPFERGGYSIVAAAIANCLMPAIWEELAFRGAIQTRMAAAVGEREAVGITAILFGIIHLSLFSLPYLFLFGLLLGVLRWKSGSLIPCSVVHLVHNGAVMAAEVLA